MKKLLLAVSLLTFSSAVACADPIKEREALMKSFGQALGQVVPVAKGEKPFDAAQMQEALATLNERVQKLDVAALFPEGSTSEKSAALPKIWEDWDGFVASADKLKTDVAAAAANPPADVAALQQQLGIIGPECGNCHEKFRQKKD
ncbi:cytochrome c [Pseudaminobacter sp. 19-2017]|uniref:Cytochrome c n=1 Tax=Pseudaminobacter soli (ex Zhang et al. 2022) TaxID=2831468 RepID=A0A942E465_9HYPH|nr:cytochrome c [Pseudaminobacter soli]MBS3648177.1 cytochrome c [Pseudaminobacter soli]